MWVLLIIILCNAPATENIYFGQHEDCLKAKQQIDQRYKHSSQVSCFCIDIDQ